MIHEPVKSSMITSIGHDASTNKMEVKFKNGKIYTYENIPRDEFEALRDAPSVGKHFNEYFMNR